MTLSSRTFADVLDFTRGTGATRISPITGFIVGVDFSTTSNTIGTGSKTFTLTADADVNREWTVGENVLVTSQAGATGTMTGTVTSYTPSTQTLVINVPTGGTTGSGTSTDWRVGSLEVRRDANGLVVESAVTNLVSGVFSTGGVVTVTSGRVSPDGSASIRLQGTGASSVYAASHNTVLLGQTYVISAYVRARTPGQNDKFRLFFNQGNGNHASQDITAPVNWERVLFSTTVTVVGSGSGGFARPSNSADWDIEFMAGSFQIEIGSTPTSLIPVRNTSWTRNADTVTFNSTALQSVRQGQGVIYVDAVGEGAAVVASGSGGKKLSAGVLNGLATGSYNKTTTLLDMYPNAAAAYSTRRLRVAWLGAALRVRRSNDNAQQDIGFDSLGNLDEAALTAFVGANSAFVTTWYDQSGNARHATQTTAANQPRIVNAGVVDKVNGRVSPLYNGTSNFVRHAASGQTIASQPFTDFVLFKSNENSGIRILLDAGVVGVIDNSTNATIFTALNGNVNASAGQTGGLAAGLPDNNTNLLSVLFAGAATNVRKNAVSVVTGNSGTNSRLGGITVGGARDTGTASQLFFSGHAPEVITYPSDQSANRAAIEANIMSYFGITG